MGKNKNMQAVKAKDSKIELTLRRALWSKGYRYRTHYKKLTGKPDIVFTKQKIAIFVDSEFWHGKDWEVKKHEFKSNRDFWIPKIERNMERDKEVNEELKEKGWTVLRFWGSEIKNNLETCLYQIEEVLNENG